MPQHIKPDPRKYCKYCKQRLRRKRYNGRLEDFGVFERRQFCDKACMALGHATRSVGRHGHLYRARQFKKDACERCGETEGLHVHHIDGDYSNNDPANLETLCGPCHLRHHWATDGRRERTIGTRRVALAAIAELHGFLDRDDLPPAARDDFKRILRGLVVP